MQADVWSTLKEVVERAWVLWELMILAQPLLVLAPSPGGRLVISVYCKTGLIFSAVFKGRAAACRSCDKVYCCAGVCSAAVAALIALITPLPYSADFRPYFTIHDPAFAQLASQQLPTNANSLPRLLGVTNLFFLKVQPNLLLFAACAPAAKDIVITVQRCLCQYDNV